MKCIDYLVSGEEFELVSTEISGLLKTVPVPEDLTPYYDSAAYISHTDSRTGIVDAAYQKVKSFNTASKLKLIKAYKGGGHSLLDYGCGTGDFVASAQTAGFTCTGFEPNPMAATRAKEKGLDVVEDIDGLGGNQFDVISLWHVLEHVVDLESTLDFLKSKLAPDGVLVVALPNYNSYDAEVYGSKWAAYDVPRHLWHFSKEAVASLFDTFGFEVCQIAPMVFDAYYVSLLSEKNRTGKTNFLKSFWVGWQSNRKARSSGQYSSLIYVLRPKGAI